MTIPTITNADLAAATADVLADQDYLADTCRSELAALARDAIATRTFEPSATFDAEFDNGGTWDGDVFVPADVHRPGFGVKFTRGQAW